MLEVQKYLQQNTLEHLTNELGIKCKVYPDDNMVLLDYDQISSPKTHPIVAECRSLILSLDTYDIISRKFNRFFNYGENLDYYKDFKWDGAIAFEKADGSLIGVYHNGYTDTWEISTRGMAKAEGAHPSGGVFRDAVLKAFGFTSEQDFQDFATDHLEYDKTYIFEYTSPLNRIVTPYKEEMMVLLSVVENCVELKEELHFDISVFKDKLLNVRHANITFINSVKDAKELVETLTGLQEGFVVYDPSTQKRMKVKSDLYLVAHTLKGDDPIPSRKNMFIATLGGDIDELLSYFPEFEPYATPVRREVNEFTILLNSVWERVKDVVDQKEFALIVKDYPFSGVLFQAKKCGTTAHAVWSGLETSKKVKMFSC